MNTSGFCTFVSNIFSESIPESEIFNGYTTFMMCNKRSDDKGIWHHRMNWLVNNYLNCESNESNDSNASNESNASNASNERNDYCQYYIKNIVDNYSGKFSPPSCKYNRFHKEMNISEKQEQDDIFTHYINISKKFEYINGKYLLKNAENIEEDKIDSGYLNMNDDDTDLEVGFEKKRSPVTRLINFLKKKDDVGKNSDALCDYNNYNSEYSENEIYNSILEEEDSEEFDDQF